MNGEELIKLCKPHSLMGPKLNSLYNAAVSCLMAPGAVAELGVYKGGSSLLLAKVFGDRPVYGFDTYTGMPCDDELIPDGHKEGDFADTSVADVMWLMKQHGAPNFIPVVGTFTWWQEDQRFAFVHLDADIFQSTRDAVQYFAPRINRDGGIFFDDYTSKKCGGVRVVADELRIGRQWKQWECVDMRDGTLLARKL